MSQPPYYSTDGRSFNASGVGDEISIEDERVALEQSIAGVVRTPSVNGRGLVADYEEITATGAVAGTPGHFTPAGATSPATFEDMDGITADPAEHWAEGEYVVTVDDTRVHWNGEAWVEGEAPEPPAGGED